jgi:hypothetical protein
MLWMTNKHLGWLAMQPSDQPSAILSTHYIGDFHNSDNWCCHHLRRHVTIVIIDHVLRFSVPIKVLLFRIWLQKG